MGAAEIADRPHVYEVAVVQPSFRQIDNRFGPGSAFVRSMTMDDARLLLMASRALLEKPTGLEPRRRAH